MDILQRDIRRYNIQAIILRVIAEGEVTIARDEMFGFFKNGLLAAEASQQF